MATTSLWKCPGCGTFQLPTAECFVCNRSATSCATCSNFRRSVAAGVGYCAADRRREPLSGLEQRPCWTGQQAVVDQGLFAVLGSAAPGTASIKRGLLELEPRR